MSNNGLLTSNDVFKTSNSDSSYFLKKGETISDLVAKSPFVVESASGQQLASLSINNAGLTSLSCSGELNILPASNKEVVIATDSNAPAGLVITNTAAPNEQATVRCDGFGNLELSASTQRVVVLAQGQDNGGLLVGPVNNTTGVGGISLRNGVNSMNPTRFTFFCASESAGGFTPGNLQLFGYNGSGPRRILDFTNDGDNLTFGRQRPGGAIVSINGSQGLGRVYDTVYNQPPVQTISVGEILQQSGESSAREETFDAMPTPNIFQNISGNFSFSVPKTGRYMIEVTMFAGSGGNELKLAGTPISTIPDNNPSLKQGSWILVQDQTLDTLALLGCNYQAIKDSQSVGPTGGVGVTLNKSFTAFANDSLKIFFNPVGTPTDGNIRISLYRVC